MLLLVRDTQPVDISDSSTYFVCCISAVCVKNPDVWSCPFSLPVQKPGLYCSVRIASSTGRMMKLAICMFYGARNGVFPGFSVRKEKKQKTSVKGKEKVDGYAESGYTGERCAAVFLGEAAEHK